MADVALVEAVLIELLERFEAVDADYRRAVLPSRRMVELVLADLDLRYHVLLRNGEFGPLEIGPAPRRADIRLTGNTDDLLAMARQELGLGDAYATGRLQVEASFVDLVRMRVLW